jgi:hypothetical protein
MFVRSISQLQWVLWRLEGTLHWVLTIADLLIVFNEKLFKFYNFAWILGLLVINSIFIWIWECNGSKWLHEIALLIRERGANTFLFDSNRQFVIFLHLNSLIIIKAKSFSSFCECKRHDPLLIRLVIQKYMIRSYELEAHSFVKMIRSHFELKESRAKAFCLIP